MLTRPIYHQWRLLGGAVWPPAKPASQTVSPKRLMHLSPPGFISYFHNDISLVTAGQQAWREQRGPCVRAPGGGTRGRGGRDMSSRDGRGHRGFDPGVRTEASRSGSSGRPDIYGLFWSLFTEEPGRGPDVGGGGVGGALRLDHTGQ